VYEFLTAVLTTERAVGRFALLSTAEEEADFNKRLEMHLDTEQGGKSA
jgi:hypothetical protein